MDDEATRASAPATVLAEWNDTARATGAESLPDLFERAAADHPGRTAVICGSVHLTYQELNAWANRLAHWLIARSSRTATGAASASINSTRSAG